VSKNKGTKNALPDFGRANVVQKTLAAMGLRSLIFSNSQTASGRLVPGLLELPPKGLCHLGHGLFEGGGLSAAVKVRSSDAQFHLNVLVFPILVLVDPEVNVGRKDTGMEKGQLVELVLDETDQGTIGLEVDGLDLYLHVNHLRVRLQKMPRVSSGDPRCTSFMRLVVTWV